MDSSTAFCFILTLISCFYFPAAPLLLPWLSLRSVLVVAMVSASAMRDICSIRVKPGKLEWRRWLDRTWACSGPKYVGLYWDRSMTYRPGTRKRAVCKVAFLFQRTTNNRERGNSVAWLNSDSQENTQDCMCMLTIQAFPNFALAGAIMDFVRSIFKFSSIPKINIDRRNYACLR